MKKRNRIVVDPGVMGGKPVVRGTRVPVQTIVGALAGGMTIADVREEYRVTSDDVHDAIAYGYA